MKKCTGRCQNTLNESCFYQKVYKSGYVGLRSICKTCAQEARDEWRKASPKDNDRNKAYNKTNAARIRGMKLRKYWPGVTWEQALLNHKAFLDAQGARCAICSRPGHPTKGLHVDHCHTTGKVRGLLCYNCNNAIGRLKDDTRILLEAVAYITRHKDAA